MWGEKGLAAVKAELSQIHFSNVFTPVDLADLTYKEKVRSFRVPSILGRKEKSGKEG